MANEPTGVRRVIAVESPADLGECHDEREAQDDMPDTQHASGTGAEQGRSVQEIPRWLDTARRQSKGIAGLVGAIEQRRAAQAAKHTLAHLTHGEVHATLADRRSTQPGRVCQPKAGPRASEPA